MYKKLHSYIDDFNKNDNEIYVQLISNNEAEQFLAEQIPLIDCPDKTIEKTYYFRWWTFRKHIKSTEKGHIITEFLPEVPWSGPYNSINCPACFHIREGRWLKDSKEWIKEYINFWLDGIGRTDLYSAWYAHAVLEYSTIKNDMAYATDKLPQLIAFFEEREKQHKRSGGIYWSHDGFDGMELSISGSGLRPTLNSYAYGDAVAIAKIADIAGNTEVKERFTKKAQEIKMAIDTLLWDNDFYKVIPLDENQDNAYSTRPEIIKENDVKELLGFIPWYFNLPDDNKDVAFRELLKSDGFKAKYGLTTAEQRHPRFLEENSHACLWNGYVWPFATSQTLVAMANLLQNYDQTTITKKDYYDILLQYAKSHKLTLENGDTVPWIDESMHPHTGRWITRDILIEKAAKPIERGKDYNHSLFCDLILSGLFGIDVKDGKFICNPLIPDSWDYFLVENLYLNGQKYRIIYDKDGTHYGRGIGLNIQEC